MIRKLFNTLLIQLCVICLLSTWCQAAYVDDFKRRAKSIYLLHSVKQTARTKNVRDDSEKRKAMIHERADSRHLDMLSYIPDQSILLPVHDVKTIVARIEALTKKIETTKEGERAQRMKFDMAYEYFLLYLHYLQEKYGVTRSSSLGKNDIIPVTDKELEQYLSLSEYYLKSFLSSNETKKDVFVQGRTVLRATDDVSFRVRNYKNLYMNVYFLAMMLECEKMAGEWGNTSSSASMSDQYDKKTWYWLDSLWKRHFKTGRSAAAYKPSAKTLFSLYELYMRYHFFGRYLRNFERNDPLLDSQTRTLLNRLYALQKETGLKQRQFYSYYKKEATKDINNTDFLVNLYLARRGYFATRDLNFTLPKYQLFELYREFYDNAARKIKHNIAYRSIIYNELILFGIGIDNIRLMEDVLYEYGLLSMRLQESEEKAGNRIKNSSRLTMAYLIANILDKKRRSGLDMNSDEYRNISETITPILISENNNYWEYASVIHSALAMYYSRQEGSYNESLAMYHAKRAFLAPCEKIAVTYGNKPNGWQNFFKLPGAQSYLELFADFQKKYQTSHDAVMPREFNSHRIIKAYWDSKQ